MSPAPCRSCSRAWAIRSARASSIACRGQAATLRGGFAGKWLELLKQIAPQVTRAAVIRDPAFVAAIAQFGAIQAVAPAIGVEVTPISVHDIDVIERAVEAFARRANGGLIVTGAATVSAVTRDLIIMLAARHKLPAVYGFLTWSPLAASFPTVLT